MPTFPKTGNKFGSSKHQLYGRRTFNSSYCFRLVDSALSNATDFLLPFYVNAAGGNVTEATQCMVAGSNGESTSSFGQTVSKSNLYTIGFQANHAALAQGDNNLWAIKNKPFSLGYFRRQDLPTHFSLAEGWTTADMYAQSVIASTIPNRG